MYYQHHQRDNQIFSIDSKIFNHSLYPTLIDRVQIPKVHEYIFIHEFPCKSLNFNVVEPRPKRRGTIAAKTHRRFPCAPVFSEHSVPVQGTCRTWLWRNLSSRYREASTLNLAASRKPSGGDQSGALAFFHRASSKL